MGQAVDQLLQAALTLPDEEQVQLITALVAAVDGRGVRPFDDTWLREIQRRSEEWDADLVQPIPWAEVKERARKRITSHGSRHPADPKQAADFAKEVIEEPHDAGLC